MAPVAWRSPYLAVNPGQYDALAAAGVSYDSSYAVGDLKSNLPVSLARTGAQPDPLPPQSRSTAFRSLSRTGSAVSSRRSPTG